MGTQAPAHTKVTRFEILRYDHLSPTDIEQWRGLCRQHPDYDSALLSPEFSETISRIRTDARIVLARTDGVIYAILPVHLRPDGLARPMGAPFCDYSGPLLRQNSSISPLEFIREAGIAAFATPAMPDPWDSLSADNPRQDDGNNGNHVIRTGEIEENTTLLENQRAKHPKRFKNFRRLRNQIEREVGPLRYEWGRPSRDALNQLLKYKQEQYRQSGLVDLTSATEPARIIDAVASSPYAFQTTLWLGDTLLSGHFGIRTSGSFHPWIAAFCPDYSQYSPGNLLLLHVLETMDEMGLETYDLANGHDHYKKYFANATRHSNPIFMVGTGVRAWRQAANRYAWHLVGADSPASITGRLRRRMEHIAVSEFRALPRIREFFYAIAARAILRRRH